MSSITGPASVGSSYPYYDSFYSSSVGPTHQSSWHQSSACPSAYITGSTAAPSLSSLNSLSVAAAAVAASAANAVAPIGTNSLTTSGSSLASLHGSVQHSPAAIAATAAAAAAAAAACSSSSLTMLTPTVLPVVNGSLSTSTHHHKSSGHHTGTGTSAGHSMVNHTSGSSGGPLSCVSITSQRRKRRILFTQAQVSNLHPSQADSH
jgi:hypothetical protein